MSTLEKINPLLYITDRDPIPEKAFDTTKWFKTERMELDFTEYVGRPAKSAAMHSSLLAYYFANGWYVDSVFSGSGGGVWQSVSQSQSHSSSSASNTSSAESKASSSAHSSSYSKLSTEGWTDGDSSGYSSSSSSAFNNGNGTNTVKQDGGPYWYASTKIRLVRRKMQGELVLKDMIADFTKAYNEGREINDERYDELVNLYALMLSRTEDEANAFALLSPEDFKPLADAIKDSIKGALEKFANSVEDLPDDWLQGRIDEINRKFDALVGQAKSKMVADGTYNSTVWPTTLSGIERERQYALNDLKDDMVTVKIDAYGKIAGITADIGKKLLDCEIAFIEAQQKMMLGPTEARNTVFKWMLEFMERREDDYPGLDKLMDVAASLGTDTSMG